MIFDGGCGFCTASAKVIRRWIHPDADIKPWQRTDIARFGLTADDCKTAVQFVDTAGDVTSGSRAQAPVMHGLHG